MLIRFTIYVLKYGLMSRDNLIVPVLSEEEMETMEREVAAANAAAAASDGNGSSTESPGSDSLSNTMISSYA